MNDFSFQIPDPVGQKLEQMIGFVSPENSDVLIIYVKVLEDQEECRDDVKVDFGQKYNLQNCKILEAVCENPMLSQFRFKFEQGELIFYYQDSQDIDSPTVVRFNEM